MSSVILRTVCGSCLALGIADLAWLDLNAGRMAQAASAAPIEEETAAAAMAPPAAAVPPPVVAVPPPAAAVPPPAVAVPPPVAIAPTPAPSAVNEPPLPIPFPENVAHEEVASCSIQFDRSRSALRADEAASLAAIAETMKRHPHAIVRVAGHADRMAWKGNRGDNLALSDDRANTVVRALGKLGIAPDRIRRTAFGDAKPLDDRASEEAYRRNRRVEVRVELTGDR
jgi:outer membrane protein OmpA-like peptidoglycan-associated protein